MTDTHAHKHSDAKDTAHISGSMPKHIFKAVVKTLFHKHAFSQLPRNDFQRRSSSHDRISFSGLKICKLCSSQLTTFSSSKGLITRGFVAILTLFVALWIACMKFLKGATVTVKHCPVLQSLQWIVEILWKKFYIIIIDKSHYVCFTEIKIKLLFWATLECYRNSKWQYNKSLASNCG